MKRTGTRRSGFTLIEVLIMIAVLAILAGIVVAYYFNTSAPAQSSGVASQLQAVRSQLQVYQSQHNGQFPSAAQLWPQLKAATNADGTTTGSPNLGPYLTEAPANVFQSNSSTVIPVNTKPNGATGWVYDSTSGNIQAAVPSSLITSLTLSTNDYVGY